MIGRGASRILASAVASPRADSHRSVLELPARPHPLRRRRRRRARRHPGGRGRPAAVRAARSRPRRPAGADAGARRRRRAVRRDRRPPARARASRRSRASTPRPTRSRAPTPTPSIAIGGGSALDTAKGARLIANQGGPFARFVGGEVPIEPPRLPLVTIPTTSGTGSEVTGGIVAIDRSRNAKFGVAGPNNRAQHALVDPVLTHELPAKPTLYGGADALAQAISPVAAITRTPIGDGVGLEATRLAARALPAVVADPSDAGARSEMACASLLGRSGDEHLGGRVGALARPRPRSAPPPAARADDRADAGRVDRARPAVRAARSSSASPTPSASRRAGRPTGRAPSRRPAHPGRGRLPDPARHRRDRGRPARARRRGARRLDPRLARARGRATTSSLRTGARWRSSRVSAPRQRQWAFPDQSITVRHGERATGAGAETTDSTSVHETELGRYVGDMLRALDDEIRAALRGTRRAVDVVRRPAAPHRRSILAVSVPHRRGGAAPARDAHRGRASRRRARRARCPRGHVGLRRPGRARRRRRPVRADRTAELRPGLHPARLESRLRALLQRCGWTIRAPGCGSTTGAYARRRAQRSPLPELDRSVGCRSRCSASPTPGPAAPLSTSSELAAPADTTLGLAQAAAVRLLPGRTPALRLGAARDRQDRTLAALVHALVERGERVLVLAHANVAVDVAACASPMRSMATSAWPPADRPGRHPQLAEVGRAPVAQPERHAEAAEPTAVDRAARDPARLRAHLDAERRERDPARRRGWRRPIDELRRERERLRAHARRRGAAAARGARWSRRRWRDTHWTTDSRTPRSTRWSWTRRAWRRSRTSCWRRLTARRTGAVFGDMRQLPPVHVPTASGRGAGWAATPSGVAGARAHRPRAGRSPGRRTLDVQHRMATPSPGRSALRLRRAACARSGTAAAAAHWPSSSRAGGAGRRWWSTRPLAPAALRASDEEASRANPLHALIARTLAAQMLAGGETSVSLAAPTAPRRDCSQRANDARTCLATARCTASRAPRPTPCGRPRRPHPFSAPSRLTGGADRRLVRRLLTVACSRPRGKLVVLVDGSFVRARLRPDDAIPTLITSALRHGVRVDAGALDLGAGRRASSGCPGAGRTPVAACPRT